MPCAKSVRDALRRLDGVRTIDIDLQTNLVTIVPEPDRELDLAAIPRAIDDAGFHPGVLHVRARGEFEPGPPPCFRIRGWSRCFRLSGERGASPPGEARIDADVDLRGAEPVLAPVVSAGDTKAAELAPQSG